MGTKGPAKKKERMSSTPHPVLQRLLQIHVWWFVWGFFLLTVSEDTIYLKARGQLEALARCGTGRGAHGFGRTARTAHIE